MKNIIIAVSLVLVGSVAYGNSLPPTPEYSIECNNSLPPTPDYISEGALHYSNH